jgi:hypothetical protein
MVAIISQRQQSMVQIDVRVTLPDGLWEHLGSRHQVCAVWFDPAVFLNWDAGTAADEMGYLLSELARKAKTVEKRQ